MEEVKRICSEILFSLSRVLIMSRCPTSKKTYLNHWKERGCPCLRAVIKTKIRI
jgi:hypothetical protein